MALPAPVGFPAPTGFPAPQPNAQTFGLDPLDGLVQPVLQPFLPQPMTVGGATQGTQTLSNTTSYIDQILGTNMAAAGDPNAWTPEMAASQADRAIARIAQANPEVAQTLQEQRTGAAPDNGGGVIGMLKGAVGAVAGLPLISQALDLMSRAGHIVPEILADEEGQSVWGNIGQALAGHSDKQMINVLDKYGVLSGDGMLESVAQSVLGFGLDLAVDPTTYLTMGLGAVGRQAAAKFGSEALAKASLLATEEGLNILDHAAATYGMRAIEGVSQTAIRETAFKQLWKEATGVVGEMGKTGKYGALTKELALTTADAAPGLLGFAMSNGQEKVWLNAMKAADAGHSIITTSGLTKLGPKLAAELGVPIEEVNAVLKGLKTSGHFASKAAYAEGKIAGALQGGVRFAVPGVRIITPALFAGMNVDFSIARRFVSGLSGQTRLMRLIESGVIDTQAGTKALKAFWKGESEKGLGGFSAMRAASPKTAEQLAGGGLLGGMRMATYSASEQVGRWTRAFSPSWQVVRGGGLGAQIASDARRMSQHVAEGARGEIWGLKRNMEEDVDLLDHVQGDEEFGKLQQPTRRVKKGAAATPETVAELTPAVTKEYLARKLAAAAKAAGEGGADEVNDGVLSILNAFPTQAAYNQGMGYFDELDQLLENRINAGLVDPKVADAERAALKARRELGAKALAAGAKSNDVLMAARVSRAVIGQGRRYGHEMGVFVESSQLTLRSSSFVHPSDAKAASEGAHYIVQDTNFRYMDDAAVDPTAGPGVHPQAITDGTAESGGLRGHVMVEEKVSKAPPPSWAQEPVYGRVPVMEKETAARVERDRAWLANREAELATAQAEGTPDAIRAAEAAVESARNALDKTLARQAEGVANAPTVLISGNPDHYTTEEMLTEEVRKYAHEGDYNNAAADLRASRELGYQPGMENLREDILSGKLNNPVVIKWDPTTGRMEIADGHHRLRIHEEEGISHVPVRIERVDSRYFGSDPEFGAVEYRGTVAEGVKMYPPGERLPDKFKPSEVFPEGVARRGGARRQHVVSVQNPVVLDLRDPVQGQRSLSTSVMGLNPLTEADREAKEALDALEQQYMDALEVGTKVTDPKAKKILKDLGVEDPDAMTDNMVKAFFAEKQAMLAELKTRRLREQGYDGAVVIQPDGTRVATVFDTADDSLPRMHHVAKNAPRSLPNQGFFPLEFTEAARAATRSGNRDSIEAGRVIRGGSKFERDLAQKLAHLSPAEAENAAQAELKAAGIGLPEGAKVFNTDPLQVVDSYADQMAAGGVRTYLGRVAQKLDIGGFTANPLVGGPGHATYQYVVNGNEEWLKKLHDQNAQLHALADRAARMGVDVQEELVPQLHALEGSVINAKEYLHAKYDEIDQALQEFEVVTKGENGMPVRLMVREGDVLPGGKIAKRTVHTEEAVIKRVERAQEHLVGSMGRPRGELIPGTDGIWKWTTPRASETGDLTTTFYYKLDANNQVLGLRSVSSGGDVEAFVDPRLQMGGIGTELAHAHWNSEGFTTSQDVMDSVLSQSLSPAGAAANLSYIKSYFDPAVVAKLKSELKQLDSVARDMSQRSAVIDNAVNEANKLRASMKVRSAPTQPALVRTEQSLAGMTELSLPGVKQSGMAMPAFMADEFHRAAYGYKSITGFHRTFRQFNTWWKGWATYRFPGFHVRNIEGAWFNNWLGGVGMGEYTHSARMMKAREELANGVSGKWANAPLGKDFLKEHGLESYYYGLPDPTYGDLQALAASVGITSAHGRAFMEARVTAEELEMRQAKRQNIIEKGYGPVGRTVEKGGRKAGDVTESMFRQAAFLKGLKDSGGDLGHARMFTMMRHGDYGDLTDFEYEKVRDLLPFYKWTRTNLPLQLHQLFEAPGKITAMLHLRDAAWNATGANYDEQQYTMPEWMREGFSIPFGKGDNRKVVMLDLPFTDLYNGTNEYISQFLPLVRPLFESYVVDKSIFSGKPLTGKPIHAAFLDFGPLPSLLSSLNVGEIGPDGKYYLDDKMQNVMSALPMFARARDWLYEDPDRVGLRSNTLASAVFGLGFRPAGDDALSSQELNFYYTNILPTMEYMKGIGYQLPTTDDIESAYGTANNALLSAGIAPGGPTQAAA